MEQLWGRVHRYGQTKHTFAFRMIAVGTFDEVMHAGGTGKVSMADDFLARPAIQSLFLQDLTLSAHADILAELLDLSLHGAPISDNGDVPTQWASGDEDHPASSTKGTRGGAKNANAVKTAGTGKNTRSKTAAAAKKTLADASAQPAQDTTGVKKARKTGPKKGKGKAKAPPKEPSPEEEEEDDNDEQTQALRNAKLDEEEEMQIQIEESKSEFHLSELVSRVTDFTP